MNLKTCSSLLFVLFLMTCSWVARAQNAAAVGCPACEGAAQGRNDQFQVINLGLVKKTDLTKCVVSRESLIGRAPAQTSGQFSGEIISYTFLINPGHYAAARTPSSLTEAVNARADERTTGGAVADEDVKYCQNPKLKLSEKVDPKTLPDDGSVWQVGTNRWTLNEEKLYADWIKKNVDESFFIHIDFATDCADAPAVIRAVYARLRNLPLSFTDGHNKVGHYSKTWAEKKTVSHWSESHWQEDVLKDQRFREFLSKVTSLISTETIPFNTYPIKITADGEKSLSNFFQPGTVLLDHKAHTRFVTNIDSSQFSAIEEMSSTNPKAVRELEGASLDRVSTEIIGEGILNWRWSVNCGRQGWLTLSPENMPGSSLEQYELGKHFDKNFNLYIQSLARAPGLVLDQKELLFQADSIKKYVGERVKLVLAAESAKAPLQTTAKWREDMSTPHRDEKIYDRINDLKESILGGAQKTDVTLADFNLAMQQTHVDIGHGKNLSLYLIYAYSVGESEPTYNFDQRWSLDVMRHDYERLLHRDLTPLAPVRAAAADARVDKLNNDDRATLLRSLAEVFQ